MSGVRVLMLGGSGLVGRALVARLAKRDALRLHLLLRRAALPLPANARAFVGDPLPVALEQWQASAQGCDVFVSALGTTRSMAGSIEAFARIDRDLVLRVAQEARKAGARQAVLVSSVDAAARSRNDYLRVKGELEEGVAALGFDRCDFLQPGLLLGAREGQPARPAERFGQRVAPLLNPLLIGPLARYLAVEAEVVAAAAAALVGRPAAGVLRHAGPALKALAGEA